MKKLLTTGLFTMIFSTAVYIILCMIPGGAIWGKMIYMLKPLLVAFFIVKKEKVNFKESINFSFKLNKWFFVPILLIPILCVMTLVINVLFKGVSLDLGMSAYMAALPFEIAEAMKAQLENTSIAVLLGITFIQSIVAGFTINAVFAFGEEALWRGYMLKVSEKLNFWKASLTVGAIWGLWHASVILITGHNYPENRVLGVFVMMLFGMALSPIMAYITIKAKSVLAAAVFHGIFNALAPVTLMLVSGGSDILNGPCGISGDRKSVV